MDTRKQSTAALRLIASRLNLKRLAVLCLLVGTLGGCEAIAELRAALKGEETDDILGNAGLRVEVEPADGITILLDGARVASMSPYHNDRLQPGKHYLEVRAMGYHTFRLPLQLTNHQTITVPVALRPRRKGAPGDPAHPDAPPLPEAPPQVGPALPPGVKPIPLTVVSKPGVPLSLNGREAGGKKITLKVIKGHVGLGEVSLPYEVGGRGLLFFSVPEDGASWQVEGKPLPAGRRFPHNKGVLRIKRTDAHGTVMSVLIKRG